MGPGTQEAAGGALGGGRLLLGPCCPAPGPGLLPLSCCRGDRRVSPLPGVSGMGWGPGARRVGTGSLVERRPERQAGSRPVPPPFLPGNRCVSGTRSGGRRRGSGPELTSSWASSPALSGGGVRGVNLRGEGSGLGFRPCRLPAVGHWAGEKPTLQCSLDMEIKGVSI